MTTERYLKASDVKEMISNNSAMQRYFPWAEQMFLNLIDDLPSDELYEEFMEDSKLYDGLLNGNEFYEGFARGYSKAMSDAAGFVKGERVVFDASMFQEGDAYHRNV